jgi:hypothetical protein
LQWRKEALILPPLITAIDDRFLKLQNCCDIEFQ